MITLWVKLAQSCSFADDANAAGSRYCTHSEGVQLVDITTDSTLQARHSCRAQMIL